MVELILLGVRVWHCQAALACVLYVSLAIQCIIKCVHTYTQGDLLAAALEPLLSVPPRLLLYAASPTPIALTMPTHSLGEASASMGAGDAGDASGGGLGLGAQTPASVYRATQPLRLALRVGISQSNVADLVSPTLSLSFRCMTASV